MNWKQKVIQFVRDDNKKVIFLINVRDNLDKVFIFFTEFSRLVSPSYLMVFFNMKIPRQFALINLRIKTSEDYLSKEDYETIDNYVFEGLSKSWHLYKNMTDYLGIPLGKMFEYDFQKYLIPRIKNLEIVRKVIDKENIQKIIVIEDTGELNEVARLYGNIINIPVLEISLSQNRKPLLELGSRIKMRLSVFLSDLLDRFALRKIITLKDERGLILIDAKLCKSFVNKDDKTSFVPCPLERGTGIRFNLIKQGFSYLPLYFTKRGCYSKDWIIYKRKWNEIYSDKEFADVFEYKGIPIWEIVNEKLSAFFLKTIPTIISNINMLGEVFGKKKIKIVVLRNDVKELERTIILGLRLAKIPSLVIQHGVLAETNGHNNLIADRFAAWGKASVDWYGRSGNSLDKFEITGNPHFDTLVNWRPKLSKRQLCRRLNLDGNKGIILFATQQINKFSSFWTDDLFLVMTDKLLIALQQFPDKQLIIKVDPYEDVSPYINRIKASSHNNVVAVKDFDIYTLIFLSEVVITLDSTVGLEAMIFDKPLITVNLTERRDRVPYAEKGAAIGVHKEEELPWAIKKTLADQETISQLKIGRTRFLEEYAYRIDGMSSERISSLIKHYIEN